MNDIDSLDFTDEDFASIDLAVASSLAKSRSPLQQFRRNKILSVTDITSLAWCELQFDYGLRQKRSRPLQSRSASFLSAAGKEIVVDQAVSASNDKTLKSGQLIHRKLEQQIRPYEILVQVQSPEERWGLRLVNMLSCLECLLTSGRAREMPIFGVLHNQVVTGIIDELVRTRAKNATANDDRKSRRHKLRLIDTKTRKTPSLPSEDDALPSRLQLMIYRRLLNSLLNTSPYFDFPSFWHRLKLDPSLPFSDRFIQQTAALYDAEVSKMTCLQNLTQLWQETALQLDVPGVDDSLQLIYRLQVKDTVKHQLRNNKTAPADISDIEDIGTKDFPPDDTVLDQHLENNMQWWRGERKPRGVSLEHHRRCFTCEYRSSCEWREERALELANKR